MSKYKLGKFNLLLIRLFGINLLTLANLFLNLPKFIFQLFEFKKSYKGKLSIDPYLSDYSSEAGNYNHEYFYQDLLVAQSIHKECPEKHLDIGSRIDGFVSNVASFRDIESLDVRKTLSKVPRVIFKQADITNLESLTMQNINEGYCDSISCLHALEHFGLGRYNDPINVNGWKIGFKNITRILQKNGIFYLSIPIGKQRVKFNANWVFDPYTIINFAKEHNMILKSLIIIDKKGYKNVELINENLDKLLNQNYNLGLFYFVKNN